jgi:hypothetical protein
VRELGNGGGNLQTLVEDNLLALETNIFGPFDKASEVTLVLNILAWRRCSDLLVTIARNMDRTNAKVFGLALEERVLCLFGASLLDASGGGGGLLTGSFLGGLVIETNHQYTR